MSTILDFYQETTNNVKSIYVDCISSNYVNLSVHVNPPYIIAHKIGNDLPQFTLIPDKYIININKSSLNATSRSFNQIKSDSLIRPDAKYISGPVINCPLLAGPAWIFYSVAEQIPVTTIDSNNPSIIPLNYSVDGDGENARIIMTFPISNGFIFQSDNNSTFATRISHTAWRWEYYDPLIDGNASYVEYGIFSSKVSLLVETTI